jgi:hypothetical protein
MATIWELISIAVFTGLGSGFGNPIGQWFYKKYLENRLDTAHEKVKSVGQKIVNADIEITKLDTEQKIKEFIGK